MKYHGKAFKGMVPGEDALVTKAGVFLLQANPGYNSALCYTCALTVNHRCSAVRGILACGGIQRVCFIQPTTAYDTETVEHARDLLALKGELS